MKNNTIIIDAMGGDHAPEAVIDGCYQAMERTHGLDLVLVGKKDLIRTIIDQKGYDVKRIQIVHADDVITNEDAPVHAVRYKTKSSMIVALQMLKNKEGIALVSAGNSGALLTGSILIVGRIRGVKRPALGAMMPSPKGKTLLIDAGLNSNCRAENYFQFAKFGHIYMRALYDIKEPTIRLLNIGAEESKGNNEIKQAHVMLLESKLNFIGNVEGDGVLSEADVVATDGFTGNALLKFYESCGRIFFQYLHGAFTRNLATKMAYLTVKNDLSVFRKTVDPDIHGGAPVLGIKDLVMKSHGSSVAETFKNVIEKTSKLAQKHIALDIEEEFA